MHLLNMHGQVVRSLGVNDLPAGTHQQTIDMSKMAAGTYYLLLNVDQRYTVVELIKQ